MRDNAKGKVSLHRGDILYFALPFIPRNMDMLSCNLLKIVQKGGSRWGQVLYMVR